MKKLFAILAIVGVMTSCKNKKKDEAKPEETTTTTTDATKTDNTSTSTAAAGVPNFSDPEVQKFANEYGAFIAEYKAGLKDPAKLMELSSNMQDWASRATQIGMKLASNPDEAAKWSTWVTEISKDLMPEMPK